MGKVIACAKTENEYNSQREHNTTFTGTFYVDTYFMCFLYAY